MAEAPGELIAAGRAVGVEEARALGLSAEEYALICAKQGRAPNEVELAMYSLLWSEHCAYKHSRLLLRTLPTEGKAVVMGPGENAGVVDAGGGLHCAMKVESHNHPSAVEPFQGAATGVGGILRDIFAVGARPIAVLDSLRFGEPDSARSRYLLERAVAGIGHYGNSIGVPTIGGELYFEPPYEQNCLINVMALGLAEPRQLMRSAAAGPGNLLVLFGSATGRDGIGGASVLASAELAEDEAELRPSVQVGDPFEESKLLECSLELLSSDLLVSLQDLGAAGLTSASAEMAAKGMVGLDIDIGAIPLREPGMQPYEIMVSESQERMLCVVEPQHLAEVLAICDRWQVHGTAIGKVTAERLLRVRLGAELVGEMPVAALVDDCPLYELQPERSARPRYAQPPARLGLQCGHGEALLALLASANLASRRPLFQQYDCLVQSRTLRRPESADAAVLLLPDGAALAASIDCNGRRVAADPYRGSVETVLECAANLACTGAEVLGVTDNLNFGNPEDGGVAWQLSESVRGLADACRALEVPIVGGNVSLYNGAAAGPIYPTPVVGMVGRIPNAARAAPIAFRQAGDAIALIGTLKPSLAAGELEKLLGRKLPEQLPPVDLPAVVAVQWQVREAVRAGLAYSAHDIAEGGALVALAECCLGGAIGARVDGAALCEALSAGTAAAGAPALPVEPERLRELLFGEGPGGFLLSGPAEALAELAGRCGGAVIGAVGGERLVLSAGPAPGGEPADLIDLAVSELEAAHQALARLFP